MTLLRTLGLDPFPWTVALGWGLVGLLVGAVISWRFWSDDASGWHFHIPYALLGLTMGVILGLGYHTLCGVCRFGFR